MLQINSLQNIYQVNLQVCCSYPLLEGERVPSVPIYVCTRNNNILLHVCPSTFKMNPDWQKQVNEPGVSWQICAQVSVPSAHSSISDTETGWHITSHSQPHYSTESILTCAAECVAGESVASVAWASERTYCVHTALFTKVDAFITLINLWTEKIMWGIIICKDGNLDLFLRQK